MMIAEKSSRKVVEKFVLFKSSYQHYFICSRDSIYSPLYNHTHTQIEIKAQSAFKLCYDFIC